MAGAYRTYDFDITRDAHSPAKPTCSPSKSSLRPRTDLGINWVDWNPCPPDKDMGLWGAVDLVASDRCRLGALSAGRHAFADASGEAADLTVYAELHNASDRAR